MKHLLIVGARGWGREVYGAATHTKAYRNGEYDVKGFLDSKTDALDGLKGNYPPIICSPEDYQVQFNDIFFIALGDSKWRKHYAELIEQKGGSFLTIIADEAKINSTSTIGEGSYISCWSIVSDNVYVGKHAIIHSFCTLGHDAKVSDYSTLLDSVFLGGGAEIGCMSTLNPKSMIIPHKRIGNNVSVGAASVVTRNIKDGLSVFGNPAKKMEF